MSQSTVQSPADSKEDKKQETAKPAPKPAKPEVTLDELISSMKTLQDDVGQISELKSEEKRVGGMVTP